MNSYTKLWHDLVTSSIWTTSDHATKVVWITMLALKDRDHVVSSSIPGLARTAGVTIQECETAIGVLSSPDKYSRTEEFEGRRISKINGGWLILNGEQHQNRICGEERREYLRIKKREERARRKQDVNSCVDSQQMSPDVNSSQYQYTPVTVPVAVPVASVQADGTAKNKEEPQPIGRGVGEPGKPSLAPLVGEGDPPDKTPETPKPKTKPLHPIVLRINALFGRKETTKWSEKEKKALVRIMPIPEEDLLLIEAYYGQGPIDPDYRRRDIATLLNNWPGEVDRARNFKPATPNQPTARNASLNTSPAMQKTAEELIEYYERTKQKL